MTKNNEQSLWKNSLNNFWANTKEVLPDFLNGLSNINNNSMNNYNNYSPKVYPLQNDNYQLQNQNFSTFNIKSTKDMIKESTNNIENVLKKPEINLNDMNLIRSMASNSISGLCKDCESVVEQRRNQPSIPTWESAQLGKEINEKRLTTMDNAVDGIIMLNLMDRAIDNKFKKINQTDPYYAQRLQEHAREKEINKNLKDMIMNLSYSMREPNENTLVLTNKLKETLNQPIQQPQNQGAGVPTGGAAMIKDEKRTYSVNNPTNQKLFNKIKRTDEQLELLNNELEEINKSNKKITKKQLLKIFEELKDIISDIEKNYPAAKNIDKSEKKTFTLKVNTLSYWFDRVLNRLPEIFNNAKRVVN